MDYKGNVIFIPNDQKTCFINIDSYENCVMEGTVFSPFYQCSKPFKSLIQLLYLTEQLLDDLSVPKMKSDIRCFGVKKSKTSSWNNEPRLQVEREGKLATFKIDVLFRQKCSWQGAVYWMDGQKQECFRSTLELIELMDSALRIQWEKESLSAKVGYTS